MYHTICFPVSRITKIMQNTSVAFKKPAKTFGNELTLKRNIIKRYCDNLDIPGKCSIVAYHDIVIIL